MEDFFYKYLSIYNTMPLTIKQSIGRIYSLCPNRLKYGSFYNIYSSRLKYFQGLMNAQKIKEEQNKLLLNQVNQAIEQIPFYNTNNKIRNIDDFRNLPVINKKIIIENFTSFVNPNQPSRRLKCNTGGSSGNPLEFYLEKNVSRTKEKVHFNWYWKQFGYMPNDRMLMIRGLPLYRNSLYEYRTIDNILNISCYALNEKNIGEILLKIIKFKPKFIHAYPSSLKILTCLSEPLKDKLAFSVNAIFLGSEYLNAIDRQYFEDFYSARVINWYGHSEKVIHGGNCLYSNEFHFYPSYGFMELLDDNNKVIEQPGRVGRLVGTGFDNRVMPFLRYDTGDMGELSELKTCKCGFYGLSLKKIVGREYEYVILSDGAKVSLTALIFGQHLDAFTRILEMQVIQHRIGEIELRIVKGTGFIEKDEENLKKSLINSVNGKLQVTVNYTIELCKTARGKNIFFISKI